MSQEVVINTGNQASVNTDTTKVFVWQNRFRNATFVATNSGYDDVVHKAGTVLGRISASNKVTPLKSGASDNSQFPVGILAKDVTVPAGESVETTVSMCIAGDVNKNLIVLQGSDALTTVVSGKTILDRIGADTVGVNVVETTEMTSFDNQ